MKELTEEVILRASKNSPNDILIFLLRKYAIGCCGSHIVSSVESVDLANNDLQTVNRLFQQFPSGWWFNLAGNTMIDKFNTPKPYSLGLLDISGAQIQSLDCFDSLSDTLIVRFNLELHTIKEGSITRQQLLQKIPKIWVLNNDFIKYDELVKMINFSNHQQFERDDHLQHDFLTSLPSSRLPHSNDLYNPKIPTVREQDYMEILTNLIPSKKSLSEYYRLDLVLDDYLQQAHLFNHHPEVIRGTYKKMPIISCNKLLLIPHRVRLDLTALLTASILFPMPKVLFIETLEILLISHLTQEEIQDLIDLPCFVKTAIVALCRRICSREVQEYELNGYLSIKPLPSAQTTESQQQQPSPVILHPTDLLTIPPIYSANISLPPRDSKGFRFVSFLRGYLSSPIERSRPMDPNSSPFTEMEADILKYLPDIPTIASCPLPGSPAYRDWVSLTARHSVILMSRSPNCPSLTKPQRSMTHELILKQLKPLLIAAEMTYEDLEITTTGPSIDGRTTKSVNVLSFGHGVPDGRASSLTWNVNGATRDYQRPWIPSEKHNDHNGIETTTPLVHTARSSKQVSGMPSENNDDIVSIGDSFFSSNDSDAGGGGVEAELSYPLTNSSLKFVTRAEVKSRSKTGDTDSEASLRSRESIFEALRKQGSKLSTTGISELARGLSLDVGLGLKPWGSRSRVMERDPTTSTVSGFSADHLSTPAFTLSSPNRITSTSSIHWNDISEPPVVLHPLTKIPIIHDKTTTTTTLPESLSPIPENTPSSPHEKNTFDLTSLNLQRLPTTKTTTRKESLLSTGRSLSHASRKNSLERMDSASSVGSWKSISRSNSGMISRCDSFNSNNGININQVPPGERKFLKQHMAALNQHRLETKKWLNGFQNNLRESFQVGADEMDIKQFFLAFDAKEERLLEKTKELASRDSRDIDYTYSNSNDNDDISVHTYQGKPIPDLKENLLRDMGTTRNVNQLHAMNKRNMKRIKEQKQIEEARKNRRYPFPKASTSPYSIQTHISGRHPSPLSSPLPPAPILGSNQPSLAFKEPPLPSPKLSWSAFQKIQPGPPPPPLPSPSPSPALSPSPSLSSLSLISPLVTTTITQEVFLTESDLSMTITPSQSNEEYDKLQSVKEHPIETTSGQLSPHINTTTTSTTAEKSIQWDSTLPITQQLRQTLNYEQIFPSPHVEPGTRGVTGKLSSSWYQYPEKIVYTLDPNTPIDILRNELHSTATTATTTNTKTETENTTPTTAVMTIQKSKKTSDLTSLIKIPIQPTIYQNKYLTPSIPVYYQSIHNDRYSPSYPLFENHFVDLPSETNSMTGSVVTVNLSASCQSIKEEENVGGEEIDLQSVGEGSQGNGNGGGSGAVGGAGILGGGGGSSGSIGNGRISSGILRNAMTRAENDEFRKNDDGTEILPSSTYSRLNTPQINLTPTHARTPSVNSLEKLLSNLPEEMKYNLPPVTTPATKLRDSSVRSKPLVVRIDPNEQRYSQKDSHSRPIITSPHNTTSNTTTIATTTEQLSVFKPATKKLKLNKNFKQTIPRSYRAHE